MSCRAADGARCGQRHGDHHGNRSRPRRQPNRRPVLRNGGRRAAAEPGTHSGQQYLRRHHRHRDQDASGFPQWAVSATPTATGLTITASSSNTAAATVTVAADYSSLTVSAQSRGTATITVTAANPDGERVSDQFSVHGQRSAAGQPAAPTVASGHQGRIRPGGEGAHA